MGINNKTNIKSLRVNPDFTLLDLNFEKAYLLGLIYGDGHVGKNNSIEICSSDLDVIESINRIFNYKLSITKKTKTARSIYINSKKLSNELRNNYALKSKKSDNITFPNIDEKFVPHFLSGEIAADGSFSYRKIKKDFSVYIYIVVLNDF